MRKIFDYITDFANLFFPNVCEACGNSLIKTENVLCLNCLYDIPRTDFCIDNDNIIINMFAGRLKLERATALFHFNKASRFQKLLHSLKYNKKPEIGIALGRELGAEMLKSNNFGDLDYIIPVPLHSKRIKERGYNQSEMIGKGISEITNIHLLTDVLIRKEYTKTQTRMTREQRWENVSGKFLVNNESIIKDKHVLLVDDVVTTGSTIEACGEALLKVSGTKLSIAVLANA